MKKIRVAAVLTCFNRKDKTLRCLNSLAFNSSEIYNRIELSIYLCDDGSTDGTSREVSRRFPEVKIVQGTGNLFWARGMALALKEAKKTNHDFYLMINDDVLFDEKMFDTMFNSYYQIDDEFSAVTGATKDYLTDEYTYGGILLNENAIDGETKVYPNSPCLECDLANWNCFLVSNRLFAKVGDIDDYYEHSYADFDYSNRIKRAGGHIYIANKYIGFCNRNSTKGTWLDSSLSFITRLRLTQKNTGVPIKSEIHYFKKYYGWKWPFRVAFPYLIIIKTTLLKNRH